MFGIAVSNYNSKLEKKTAVNTSKFLSMQPSASCKYFSTMCGIQPCNSLLNIKETKSCNYCNLKEPKKTFSSLTKEESNKNGWGILEEVIIGIVLGDAWLEKAKVNGRLRFEQSDIRTDFFFHVWNYFVFLRCGAVRSSLVRSLLIHQNWEKGSIKEPKKFIKLGILLLQPLLSLHNIIICFILTSLKQV